MELSLEARLRGTYILGKTGTGKSAFLEHLIVDDIVQGYGVLVLDPHGSLVENVLGQLPATARQRVHVLELTDQAYPFGLNIYECPDPTDPLVVARTVSPVMQLFERLWGAESAVMSWGPRMAQYLRNCALTLVENPGYTMAEIPLLLTQKAPRQRLTAQVTNPSVKAFWQAFEGLRVQEQLDRVDSTFNKVDDFISNPLVRNIVGQSESTIDVGLLMEEGGVLLVKLDPQLTDLTSVVGALLISRTLSSALQRRPDAPPFMLFADEYQRFMTPDFATLLSEARKYNVATTIAHQFRGQLDQRNKGAVMQAGTVVVFEVTPEDAQDMAGLFDATPPEPKVIGQRPKIGLVPDVVGRLMAKGHPHPDVQNTIAYWHGLLDKGYLFPGKVFPPAYNQFLTALMTKEKKPEEAIGELVMATAPHYHPDLLDDVVVLLRPFVEFAEYPSEVFLDKLIDYFEEKLRKFVAKRIDRRQNKELEELIKRQQEAAEKYRRGDEIRLPTMELTHGFGPKVPDYFTLTLEGYEKRCAQQRADLESKRDEKIQDKVEQEYDDYVEPLLTLTLVGRVLSREPLLGETGEYEPIYESDRPYADVHNEIANALATQGRFHYWAKSLGEQMIEASPAPLSGSLTLAEREVIRERSRAFYGRPRMLVEVEITRRQEALLGFASEGVGSEPSPQPMLPRKKPQRLVPDD